MFTAINHYTQRLGVYEFIFPQSRVWYNNQLETNLLDIVNAQFTL